VHGVCQVDSATKTLAKLLAATAGSNDASADQYANAKYLAKLCQSSPKEVLEAVSQARRVVVLVKQRKTADMLYQTLESNKALKLESLVRWF